MEVTVYVGGVRRPPSQTRAYPIRAFHGGPTRQGSLDTGQVAVLGCREQFLVLPHEGGGVAGMRESHRESEWRRRMVFGEG